MNIRVVSVVVWEGESWYGKRRETVALTCDDQKDGKSAVVLSNLFQWKKKKKTEEKGGQRHHIIKLPCLGFSASQANISIHMKINH